MMNAASFYIMLVLAGRAVAIRTTDEGASLEQVNESWSWPRWGKRKQISELRGALAKGKEAEMALSCSTIPNYLIKQIEESGAILLNPESPDHDVEKALTLQQVVIAFVAAADRRKCLNEVMADQRLQKRLNLLLEAVPSFLHFPKTEMGRQRFQEAYLQLVSFQQGSLSLAANMSDRKMLLGFDIREGYTHEANEFTGRDCPEPCKQCDHYKAGSFGFRCLLKRADKNRRPQLAGRSGMKCEEPKKRSWLRYYPFSRICEVADFKESALQHVHVSAMLACASATIVMGLQDNLTEARRQDMHNICVMNEQGQTVSTEGQHQYSEQLKVDDLELSEKEKAHFGILLTWGMASGLAALRQASRGNERPASLLEEARELPEDYLAPFAARLVNQSLRPQDLAMYGDQSLVEREQMLEQLDKCEEVWNLKLQNTFAEGTKPLSALGLKIEDDETTLVKPCGMDCSPLKLLYFGVLSTAWVTLMSYLFIPVGLGLGLSALYFGLIWVPITLWGLWKILFYTVYVGDILSSSHRLRMKESNLKGCMKSLKEAE